MHTDINQNVRSPFKWLLSNHAFLSKKMLSFTSYDERFGLVSFEFHENT